MTASIDFTGIRFSPSSSAFRIAQLPVLISLLDQERLTALVADVQRARAVAAEAGKLASQGTADLSGLIDAGIREGVDAAKLVDRIVKARSDSAARKDAAAHLNAAADRYTMQLEGWLDDQAFDLIDVLAERLEDLLDRGEEVIAALDGACTADEAVDADKGAEWRQWRELHREYIGIREAHVALLKATAPGKFGGDNSTLAFAFFESPTRAWKYLADAYHGHVRTSGLDALGVPASPFDLGNPSDTDHWLAAVTRRAELGTHVVDADHALTEFARVIKAGAPDRTQDYEPAGEYTKHYGEAGMARRTFGA